MQLVLPPSMKGKQSVRAAPPPLLDVDLCQRYISRPLNSLAASSFFLVCHIISAMHEAWGIGSASCLKLSSGGGGGFFLPSGESLPLFFDPGGFGVHVFIAVTVVCLQSLLAEVLSPPLRLLRLQHNRG